MCFEHFLTACGQRFFHAFCEPSLPLGRFSTFVERVFHVCKPFGQELPYDGQRVFNTCNPFLPLAVGFCHVCGLPEAKIDQIWGSPVFQETKFFEFLELPSHCPNRFSQVLCMFGLTPASKDISARR